MIWRPPSSKSGVVKRNSFARGVLPFLALIAFGSWGLSQFLKLPNQVKDERARRRKKGQAKFDLDKEHERMQTELGDLPEKYENKRIPGPRPKGRVAAD